MTMMRMGGRVSCFLAKNVAVEKILLLLLFKVNSREDITGGYDNINILSMAGLNS